MKGGKRISEAKGHNKVFVVPVTGAEGSLPLVTFTDSDLVIGVLEIDLREDCGAAKAIK